MIAVVSAGDEFENWWSFEERRKTDAITKEVVSSCIKNLMPRYSGDQKITAILIAWGEKEGVLSTLKVIATESAILCVGGIWDQLSSNINQCDDCACDYNNNNDGHDKDYPEEPNSNSDEKITCDYNEPGNNGRCHRGPYDPYK